MPELISNPDQIQINEQQEIQQIMGDPPSWIVRWGISLVMISVTVLVLIAYIVRYPDIIPAPITLETENPPIRIPARMNGKIESLKVEEGTRVETGQILAILENTADFNSIIELSIFTATVSETGLLDDLDLPKDLSLGVIQDSWSSFTESYKDYVYFLRKDKTSKKARLLKQQIKDTKDLNQVLKRREASFKTDKQIIESKLKRTRNLLAQGLASVVEYEDMQSEYSSIKRQISDMGSEFINNEITIRQLERSILDLAESKDKKDNDKQLKTEETFKKLKSDVEAWKLDFLFTAPIDGVVSFAKPLAENEFVSANDEIMTIVPDNKKSGEIRGFAALPFDGAGKVKIGQRVNIRLNDFPYEQYGSINGAVKKIALIPQKNSYLVEVSLPKKLRTTYNKDLDFRQQMQGMANIVTEERRYLTRILDKVISAFKNK